MIAATIWNQLVLTLKENPTLSGYIKAVYELRRYDIEPESLPCLMLEPVSDGEVAQNMNNVQNVYLTLNLYALSPNNFNEFPKAVVGDELYKGIFNINDDIRACLDSSCTLGDTVIEVRPQMTNYDSGGESYPVRGLLMPLKILYRQVDSI